MCCSHFVSTFYPGSPSPPAAFNPSPFRSVPPSPQCPSLISSCPSSNAFETDPAIHSKITNTRVKSSPQYRHSSPGYAGNLESCIQVQASLPRPARLARLASLDFCAALLTVLSPTHLRWNSYALDSKPKTSRRPAFIPHPHADLTRLYLCCYHRYFQLRANRLPWIESQETERHL